MVSLCSHVTASESSSDSATFRKRRSLKVTKVFFYYQAYYEAFHQQEGTTNPPITSYDFSSLNIEVLKLIFSEPVTANPRESQEKISA